MNFVEMIPAAGQGDKLRDKVAKRGATALKATLHTDGAARRQRGEPTGPAGIGAVLTSESGSTLAEIATSIGIATNNVAEYRALIAGLEMALEKEVTDVEVIIDSPVVAGHLVEGHRVKADHLRPLIARVRELLALFSTVSLTRVPRSSNAHADRLANKGIEGATKGGQGDPP